MKIEKLVAPLNPVRVDGALNRVVRSLCTDSRRSASGALFFALPGGAADGNDYVCEAVSRGAVGIVSERPGKALWGAAYIQVDDIQSALSLIARTFYNYQPEQLALTGVTGTNGKTTVAFLVQHMLNTAGCQSGMLGTVHYSLGKRTLPAHRTTPGAVEVFGMLEQMVHGGCQACVMEVSSHGIVQRRIEGLRFDACAFLNLTRDHMDYHESMEDYFQAKASLFRGASGSRPGIAVINMDDSYGKRLWRELLEDGSSEVVCFGETDGADYRAKGLELREDGTFFVLQHAGSECEVFSPLLGRHNVSNVLAALSLVSRQGYDLKAAVKSLMDFGGVPGRMERIAMGQSFNVVVDYAHTDDALSNALGMLRGITSGRLIVVFGCGGDRDRMKRPLMTRVVMQLADQCYATADNPRSEAVNDIFTDMRKGIIDEARIHFIEDRRKAIAAAIDSARAGDCVLIAGKGHETYQEFAHTVVPFDDRLVARELLRNRLECHAIS